MLLNDDTDVKQTGANVDHGPKTELTHWRNRMQRITNWSEQLKSADFMKVKTTL